MTACFLGVLVIAIFACCVEQTRAFAEDQSCGGSAGWVRGAPYGQMRIASYSTSTTACVLRMTSPSTPVSTYNAGQQFTFQLTSSSSYGYKVVVVGGAKISSPSSGGALEGQECLNYHSKRLSASFRVTAPTKGAEIRIKALCGTDEKAMHIATDIVLQPGPDVLPPVADPSTDPAYAFQKSMAGNMMLHFKQNASHVAFKVVYNAVGYVSFGVGSAMVPSVVMIGMNPASNAGYNAIGLYRLIAKSGSNAQIAQLLAGPGTLASYGIVDASYSIVGGVSTMRFSVLLNSQVADFRIADPAGAQGVDVNFAAGGAGFGMHSIAGSFLQMNFASGVNSGSGSTSAGGGAGTSPSTPQSGGVSSDPNYAFMASLNHAITLFYKKNATHGSFKMTMKNGGYLSLGTTLLMVGSVAVVGMDPAQNPGYPSVGLYAVNSKTGSNTQIMSNVAVTSAALAQYGIADTEFGVDSSGVSMMKFSLELAKQQPAFTLFNSAGSSTGIDFIWAGGPAVYGYHTYAGSVPKADFSTALGPSLGFDIDVNLAAHIVLMIFAWELMGPFGVIVPLLNNVKHSIPGLCRLSTPVWFKFHWVALTLGVIAGYGGTLAGYLFVESRQSTHWSGLHKGLGLAILVASILQPMWGMLRPPKAKTGTNKSTLRKTFEFCHPFLGYILVLAGLANNITGMEELTEMAGAGRINFRGLSGESGWSGELGAFVLTCSVLSCILLGFGFVRSSLHNYKQVTPSTLTVSTALVQSGDLKQRIVTMSEASKHQSPDDCWVVYNGKVYDVSGFLSSHPGGRKAILPYAGKDMTMAFNDVGHSGDALSILSRYSIGILEGGVKSDPEMHELTSSNVFLSGGNHVRRQVTVKGKTLISHNVFLLEFALPSPTMTLGLPTGKHICLFAPCLPGTTKGQWNNSPDAEAGKKEIQRKYTPISSASCQGTFTLVVKCYRRNPPKFPDGGRMSRYLDGLKIGDQIDMAGPFGTHQYLGRGRFMDNGRELAIRSVGMVAGGSGITPILQIAQAMLEDKTDPCVISVLYANSTFDDVLMKSTLDGLARMHPDRFRVWYTLSKAPAASIKWAYSVGRITKDMLQQNLPPPSKDAIIISCGPPGMMECVADLLKREVGYLENQIIDY